MSPESGKTQHALSASAGLSFVSGKDGDGVILDSLPNNRLVIGASYQVSAAWKLGGFSTFAAGRDKPDGARRAGFAVHDLYALWTPQAGPLADVGMRLGVDNVLNKTYVPATWSTGPAPGRNVSFSVSRAF